VPGWAGHTGNVGCILVAPLQLVLSRDRQNGSPVRRKLPIQIVALQEGTLMKVLTDFAGQNWLITPVALAVGEPPPANIHEQQFLLVLSGVVFANLQGNSGSQWLRETLSFLPDMAGPQNSGPLKPSSASGIRPAGDSKSLSRSKNGPVCFSKFNL
jgi:hypothetical protein